MTSREESEWRVEGRSKPQRALAGLAWGLGGTAVTAVVQIGYSAIMARLLRPEDFGLVALALAFLRFGSFFSQLGVGHALIQKAQINAETVRTAFTVSVVLGAVMGAGFALLAPIAGSLASTSEAIVVARVLAGVMLINGLGTTATSLLSRRLQFRSIAVIDTLSYLVGYVIVGLGLALTGFGVWSLVGATLCQAALKAMIPVLIVRHPIAPLVDRIELVQLYGYGSRFSLLQFLAVVQHASTLAIIGRSLGSVAIGIYDRARLLVTLPFETVEANVSRVAFPLISRSQSNATLLRQVFMVHATFIASLALPALAGMAVSARPLVDVLLGEQWPTVTPLIPVVAVSMLFSLLAHFARVLSDAMALLNQRLQIEAGQVVVLVVSLFLLHRYGLIGMAAAVTISQMYQYVLYVSLIKRRLGFRLTQYLQQLVPGAVASVLVGSTLAGTLKLLTATGVSPILTLIAQVLAGALLMLILGRSVLFKAQRRELEALVADSQAGSLNPVIRRVLSVVLRVGGPRRRR